MTRSILSGLFALVSVGAVGLVPLACQSGGVGDECTPEDEYNTQFPGFKVAEENIESRSFQCSTRICLVNHFQGRRSCPFGQSDATLKACNGLTDTTTCGMGSSCKESQTLAPECTCDANKPGDCANACGAVSGLTCDPKLKLCTCTSDQIVNGATFYCSLADKGCTGGNCTKVLKAYVCHKPDSCQSAESVECQNCACVNLKKDGGCAEVCKANFCTTQVADASAECATCLANTCKSTPSACGAHRTACCIPGTDTPVAVPVCGQCDADSRRNANAAVYCSCRCRRVVCTTSKCTENKQCGAEGVCEKLPGASAPTCVYPNSAACDASCTAAGAQCDDEPGDDNFNYCQCPTDFTCSQIRKNVGLGDAQLTGSYCIKAGSEFKGDNACGQVTGNADPTNCKGVGG